MVISNSKIYGVPLYGCSWLPLNLKHDHHNHATDEDAHDHDHDAAGKDDHSHDHDNNAADESPPSIKTTRHVVLAGGGGEGNIGIPNALLISQFDVNSNSLCDDPVCITLIHHFVQCACLCA